MNIEKIKTAIKFLENNFSRELSLGQYTEETLGLNFLKEALAEAERPEGLLPFNLETAIAEPERVICPSNNIKIQELFFTKNKNYPLVVFYEAEHGEHYTSLFNEKGKQKNNQHCFLKLKPKPKVLTKVWVSRYEIKTPNGVCERMFFNKSDAEEHYKNYKDAIGLNFLSVVQEREIEI